MVSMKRSHLGVLAAACVLTIAGSASSAGGSTQAPQAVALPTPPSFTGGSWTARVLFTTKARSLPGAGTVVMTVRHFAPYTQGPHVLMVTGAQVVNGRMWVRVLLPKRPNRSQGWISEDALELRRITTWIRVSVRARTVRVFRNGRRIKSFGAAVGTGGTPTPTGLFAIHDPVPTSGELGPYIFVLTAHSNVLKTFAGGDGVVAIHGWPASNVLGKAVSHGCVRMSRAGAGGLAPYAKPGTPVEILK